MDSCKSVFRWVPKFHFLCPDSEECGKSIMGKTYFENIRLIEAYLQKQNQVFPVDMDKMTQI
jgi:hypothetical protein